MNSEYWEKRIANKTWSKYNSLEMKNRKLIELYQDAINDIVESFYELAEKYSVDGTLSRSEIHKYNRLTNLIKKYEGALKELGQEVEEYTKDNMFEAFEEIYSDISRAVGNKDFTLPNKKLMEELVEEPWRGGNFSDRLWSNQTRLLNVLTHELTIGLEQGDTVTNMAVKLKNVMNTGFSNAHRLVRTETMHILNQAAIHGYEDAGVEKIQIWTAVDERVCDECGTYHEKIYPLKKAPVLPFHPNCRCTYLPVIDSDDIIEQ